jgi:hypothetical protein
MARSGVMARLQRCEQPQIHCRTQFDNEQLEQAKDFFGM